MEVNKSKLTPEMVDSIARILDFSLETYIAKQLRDQGITTDDVYPYLNQGLNNIYNALRDMENANLAFPTSGQGSVTPDDLPDVQCRELKCEQEGK